MADKHSEIKLMSAGAEWVAKADCSDYRESPRSSRDKAAHCGIMASRSDRWTSVSKQCFLSYWVQQSAHVRAVATVHCK